MGEKTNIPWCDSTWNWIRGCSKVSPGCKNCYITSTAPFRVSGQKYGDARVVASDATFNAPLRWNKNPWACDGCGKAYPATMHEGAFEVCRECFDKTGHSSLHRRRVFSLSLGDWLDPWIPVWALVRALDIMRQCEDLDFLLLSKRVELWQERLEQAADFDLLEGQCLVQRWLTDWLDGKAPANIWIGTSVEDGVRRERIRELWKIPATVRFLSCEPLLEDINLRPHQIDFLNGINWVIIGGESGPNARPCNVEWIRSLRDQCKAANVPCYIKQLGSVSVYGSTFLSPMLCAHPKGGDPLEWPDDLRVRQFPEVGR